MNNSVYGKTVENLRNRVDLSLENAKGCQKLVSLFLKRYSIKI